MNIKLHLNSSEFDPIKRTADALGCGVEDLVYVAVDEYMSRLGDFKKFCGAECQKIHTDFNAMREQVLNTKSARKNNLPPWADSAESVHAYESMPDNEPEKSDASRF